MKYDTAAMSRIINLCLCAYLLCFSEKTQVDRQENIKTVRCNILKAIMNRTNPNSFEELVLNQEI